MIFTEKNSSIKRFLQNSRESLYKKIFKNENVKTFD